MENKKQKRFNEEKFNSKMSLLGGSSLGRGALAAAALTTALSVGTVLTPMSASAAAGAGDHFLIHDAAAAGGATYDIGDANPMRAHRYDNVGAFQNTDTEVLVDDTILVWGAAVNLPHTTGNRTLREIQMNNWDQSITVANKTLTITGDIIKGVQGAATGGGTDLSEDAFDSVAAGGGRTNTIKGPANGRLTLISSNNGDVFHLTGVDGTDYSGLYEVNFSGFTSEFKVSAVADLDTKFTSVGAQGKIKHNVAGTVKLGSTETFDADPVNTGYVNLTDQDILLTLNDNASVVEIPKDRGLAVRKVTFKANTSRVDVKGQLLVTPAAAADVVDNAAAAVEGYTLYKGGELILDSRNAAIALGDDAHFKTDTNEKGTIVFLGNKGITRGKQDMFEDAKRGNIRFDADETFQMTEDGRSLFLHSARTKTNNEGVLKFSDNTSLSGKGCLGIAKGVIDPLTTKEATADGRLKQIEVNGAKTLTILKGTKVYAKHVKANDADSKYVFEADGAANDEKIIEFHVSDIDGEGFLPNAGNNGHIEVKGNGLIEGRIGKAVGGDKWGKLELNFAAPNKTFTLKGGEVNVNAGVKFVHGKANSGTLELGQGHKTNLIDWNSRDATDVIKITGDNVEITALANTKDDKGTIDIDLSAENLKNAANIIKLPELKGDTLAGKWKALKFAGTKDRKGTVQFTGDARLTDKVSIAKGENPTFIFSDGKSYKMHIENADDNEDNMTLQIDQGGVGVTFQDGMKVSNAYKALHFKNDAPGAGNDAKLIVEGDDFTTFKGPLTVDQVTDNNTGNAKAAHLVLDNKSYTFEKQVGTAADKRVTIDASLGVDKTTTFEGGTKDNFADIKLHNTGTFILDTGAHENPTFFGDLGDNVANGTVKIHNAENLTLTANVQAKTLRFEGEGDIKFEKDVAPLTNGAGAAVNNQIEVGDVAGEEGGVRFEKDITMDFGNIDVATLKDKLVSPEKGKGTVVFSADVANQNLDYILGGKDKHVKELHISATADDKDFKISSEEIPYSVRPENATHKQTLKIEAATRSFNQLGESSLPWNNVEVDTTNYERELNAPVYAKNMKFAGGNKTQKIASVINGESIDAYGGAHLEVTYKDGYSGAFKSTDRNGKLTFKGSVTQTGSIGDATNYFADVTFGGGTDDKVALAMNQIYSTATHFNKGTYTLSTYDTRLGKDTTTVTDSTLDLNSKKLTLGGTLNFAGNDNVVSVTDGYIDTDATGTFAPAGANVKFVYAKDDLPDSKVILVKGRTGHGVVGYSTNLTMDSKNAFYNLSIDWDNATGDLYGNVRYLSGKELADKFEIPESNKDMTQNLDAISGAAKDQKLTEVWRKNIGTAASSATPAKNVEKMTTSVNHLHGVDNANRVLSDALGAHIAGAIGSAAAGDEEVKTPVEFYINPFFANLKKNSEKETEGYKSSVRGVGLGIDFKNDGFLGGIALSFGTSDVKYTGEVRDGDKTKGESLALSLYGVADISPEALLQTVVSFNKNDLKVTQDAGNGENYEGKPSAKGVDLSLLFGYKAQVAEQLTVTPMVGGEYHYSTVGSFELKTPSGLALKNQSYSNNTVLGVAGVRLNSRIQWENMLFIPEFHFFGKYNFQDKDKQVKTEIPGVANPLLHKVAKQNRFTANLGAQFAFEKDCIRAKLGYDCNLNGKTTVHQGFLRLGYIL